MYMYPCVLDCDVKYTKVSIYETSMAFNIIKARLNGSYSLNWDFKKYSHNSLRSNTKLFPFHPSISRIRTFISFLLFSGSINFRSFSESREIFPNKKLSFAKNSSLTVNTAINGAAPHNDDRKGIKGGGKWFLFHPLRFSSYCEKCNALLKFSKRKEIWRKFGHFAHYSEIRFAGKREELYILHMLLKEAEEWIEGERKPVSGIMGRRRRTTNKLNCH